MTHTDLFSGFSLFKIQKYIWIQVRRIKWGLPVNRCCKKRAITKPVWTNQGEVVDDPQGMREGKSEMAPEDGFIHVSWRGSKSTYASQGNRIVIILHYD